MELELGDSDAVGVGALHMHADDAVAAGEVGGQGKVGLFLRVQTEAHKQEQKKCRLQSATISYWSLSKLGRIK